MQVTVYHEGQLRFRANARGHHYWADQPFAKGGQDSGMTPTEWLLSALGSCMGMAAVRYLETYGIEPEGLQLSLRAESREPNLVRIPHISVHVVLATPLERHQRRGLLQAVESCELLQVMQHPPEMTTEILSALPRP
jgi:putative redox protein